MAVLRIHTVPGDETLLRKKAEEVTDFGPELKRLADDMVETLPGAGGIGLAAPQVGHSLRMVLIDISECGPVEERGTKLPWEPEAGTGPSAPSRSSGEIPEPLPPAFFLCNPVIVEGDGDACLAEGCLSVPGLRVEVPRKARVVVEARDLSGKSVRFEAGDLLAIVIQHEMDHLDGRLIVDYAEMGHPTFRDEDLPEGRPVLD